MTTKRHNVMTKVQCAFGGCESPEIQRYDMRFISPEWSIAILSKIFTGEVTNQFKNIVKQGGVWVGLRVWVRSQSKSSLAS